MEQDKPYTREQYVAVRAGLALIQHMKDIVQTYRDERPYSKNFIACDFQSHLDPSIGQLNQGIVMQSTYNVPDIIYGWWGRLAFRRTLQVSGNGEQRFKADLAKYVRMHFIEDKSPYPSLVTSIPLPYKIAWYRVEKVDDLVLPSATFDTNYLDITKYNQRYLPSKVVHELWGKIKSDIDAETSST